MRGRYEIRTSGGVEIRRKNGEIPEIDELLEIRFFRPGRFRVVARIIPITENWQKYGGIARVWVYPCDE